MSNFSMKNHRAHHSSLALVAIGAQQQHHFYTAAELHHHHGHGTLHLRHHQQQQQQHQMAQLLIPEASNFGSSMLGLAGLDQSCSSGFGFDSGNNGNFFYQATTTTEQQQKITEEEDIKPNIIVVTKKNKKKKLKEQKQQQQATQRNRKKSSLLVATEELKKPSSGSRKKKNMANEQIRNAEIKTKIKELEKNLERYLPTKKNVPRIRTLRLSKAYIEHMVNVLNGSRKYCGCLRCPGEQADGWAPLTLDDFRDQVSREFQVTNTYKQRAAEEMSSGGNGSSSSLADRSDSGGRNSCEEGY